MLSIVQILEFELGSGCNLGGQHSKCPNRHPDRYALLDTEQPVGDDLVVGLAVEAYATLNFAGLVGWIYYNEPLLEMERMFGLMDRIWQRAPFARFMLWSNGTLLPADCARFANFEQIWVSLYDEALPTDAQVWGLARAAPWAQFLPHRKLDDRLVPITPVDPAAPCFRPFVELIIDNYGNAHLCCYDWQGRADLGNVHREPLAAIAARWRAKVAAIVGEKMLPTAPPVCRECGRRSNGHQLHDRAAIVRAEVFRSSLTPDP